MEKTLSSERAFSGRHVKVDVIVCELPDRRQTVREVVQFPDVVVLLGFDKDGRVLLVRQYRKAVESDMLEPVAGKVDPGETPEEAIKRELKEETGYDCKDLKKVGTVHPTPGYSTETQHFFFARIVGKQALQSENDKKRISIVWMEEDDLLEHIVAGKSLDGKLMSAIAFSAVLDSAGDGFNFEGDDEEEEPAKEIEKRVVFVSGHLDLTQEEFDAHYRDQLIEFAKADCGIVVGDAKGCDLMVQQLFSTEDAIKRTGGKIPVVYHMFNRPRNNVGNFQTVGGFKSDKARDTAMTSASTEDLAWVRPGKETSGTAKNIARRNQG